jgi:hypothetical protein
MAQPPGDPLDLPGTAPAPAAPRRRFVAGRRSRAVVIGVVLVVVGLVALDVVPRQLAGSGQVTACGLEDLEARIAAAPIPWQLVTGGLRGAVVVPPEAAIDLVERRLSDTALVDPEVSLVDEAVKVDAFVDAPIGRVPVQMLLDVATDEQGLTFEPSEVSVAGRKLASGSSTFSLGAGTASGGDAVCSAPADARVTGVDVSPTGVVLTVSLERWR